VYHHWLTSGRGWGVVDQRTMLMSSQGDNNTRVRSTLSQWPFCLHITYLLAGGRCGARMEENVMSTDLTIQIRSPTSLFHPPLTMIRLLPLLLSVPRCFAASSLFPVALSPVPPAVLALYQTAKGGTTSSNCPHVVDSNSGGYGDNGSSVFVQCCVHRS
jgi:hypothetical protein